MKFENERIETDPVVEAELDRLPTMPIAQLRARYSELFRTEPPKAFGPDLLRRSIAHRIQERAYGGLTATTQRFLDQLVKAAAAKPNGRLALQLPFSRLSESMGNHDSNIVDADSVD